MTYDGQTSIKALGLSTRATNALLRNGVTNIRELLAVPEVNLYAMRGIGVTVLEEILATRGVIEASGVNDSTMLEAIMASKAERAAKEFPTFSFGDYLKNICKRDQTFQITLEYYNNYSRGTMKIIGDNYGITRSRVQQVIAKCTERLRIAYMAGTVKSDTVSHFDNYAIQKTEIHTIVSDDPYFTGPGLAHLMSSFRFSKYKVFSNANINGKWLVFADDNVSETFSLLISDLKYRDTPLKISDVEMLYGINDNMLMSVKGIIEKQGYVTHESNKYSTGKDRHFIVRKYLEAVDRPASINELANNTSLTFQQVRGAISDKDKYINVGKSIYDLVDRKYEDKNIDDLAEMILTAEDRALKVDQVINFIKKYRNVDDYMVTYALLGSDKIKSIGDYYLLMDWSADKIQKKKKANYSIGLDEAVLEIISSSDEIYDFEKVSEALKKYGDSVSRVSNSIKTTLIRLADRNLIKRVGGARTGCYKRVSDKQYTAKEKLSAQKKIDEKLSLSKFINASIGGKVEIRYKTDRVNSEKRWRAISVRGQDARYIYTDDLNTYGQRVKYVKDKVVEFRDLSNNDNVPETAIVNDETSTNWYQDVLSCVKELDEIFTLEEVYGFEEKLSEKHPDNQNVRAKIRQQLQLMRDKSVIDFVIPGIYQKK